MQQRKNFYSNNEAILHDEKRFYDGPFTQYLEDSIHCQLKASGKPSRRNKQKNIKSYNYKDQICIIEHTQKRKRDKDKIPQGQPTQYQSRIGKNTKQCYKQSEQKQINVQIKISQDKQNEQEEFQQQYRIWEEEAYEQQQYFIAYGFPGQSEIHLSEEQNIQEQNIQDKSQNIFQTIVLHEEHRAESRKNRVNGQSVSKIQQCFQEVEEYDRQRENFQRNYEFWEQNQNQSQDDDLISEQSSFIITEGSQHLDLWDNVSIDQTFNYPKSDSSASEDQG